jgi:TPR repeat protein
MGEPMGAFATGSTRLCGRGRLRRRLAAPALAVMAMLIGAAAQKWVEPPMRPEIKAALTKADAGDAAPLLRLADGGDADAQYYAGSMYIFGRGKIARNLAKGCAYEHKASARRADAAHLVGLCYQNGSPPDKAKAEAAYTRATAMGFAASRCVLGRMLMGEPGQGARGMGLCKQSASAGEVDAQLAVADAYFTGRGVKADHAEARRWYATASRAGNAQASLRLGEMYATGDGGKKDARQAVKLWQQSERAGNPLACILVADQLFADLTGGKKPGPGQYAFRGGVPVADLDAVQSWYEAAEKRDPRPDVKKRAAYALAIVSRLKAASGVKVTRK